MGNYHSDLTIRKNPGGNYERVTTHVAETYCRVTYRRIFAESSGWSFG